MISVVRRTGHSTYYVEKGMGATGKTPAQIGMQGMGNVQGGGEFACPHGRKRKFVIRRLCSAFPIWLDVSWPFAF